MEGRVQYVSFSMYVVLHIGSINEKNIVYLHPLTVNIIIIIFPVGFSICQVYLLCIFIHQAINIIEKNKSDKICVL